MDNEFEYYLDQKTFGRIMRWRMKWYLIGMALAFLIEIGFTIPLSLLASHDPSALVWLIVVIAVCSPVVGFLYFKAIMIGHHRYYGHGKIIYNEYGSVTYKGDCVAWNPRLGGESATIIKSFRPEKIIEHNGHWLFIINRSEYIAVPKTVSIEPIKSLLVEKKKPRR